MLFRNLLLGSLLLTSPAQAAGPAAAKTEALKKIMAIANVEGIKVDGKSITRNTEIAPTASIVTTSLASIRIGDDNVMNIAAGSQLNLVPEKDGKVGIQLQKGSVEGVRRIDPSLEFEVPGGRYEIKVGTDENSPVQFKAIDTVSSFTPSGNGNVNPKPIALPVSSPVVVTSNINININAYAKAFGEHLQKGLPTSISLEELKQLKLADDAERAKKIAPGESAPGVQNVITAGETSLLIGTPDRAPASAEAPKGKIVTFLPMVPGQLPTIGDASPKFKPITFDPPVAKPNLINRDPLQTPKNPTVTVKFKY
jgi:hypothetical protein